MKPSAIVLVLLAAAVLVGLAGSQHQHNPLGPQPQFVTVTVLGVGDVNRYSLNIDRIESFVRTGDPTITIVWMQSGDWFHIRADYDFLVSILGVTEIPD